MVKGISKRVIVVKAPVSNIFDEAIFILGDKSESLVVNEDDLLREARALADDYVKAHCLPRKNFRTSRLFTAIISSGITLALSFLLYMLLR